MKQHRNSQRRIYFYNATYFCTTSTYNRIPFFKEEILCELFMENLRLCKQLKGFELYSWVLCHDHFHILFKPNDEWGYSKVMKSLKENVSCDINRIIEFNEGATPASRLREIYRNKFDIFDYHEKFLQKYGKNNPFPYFKWQKSYYDHVIRNEGDFENHFKYIQWNPEKHNLPDNWKYVFTHSEYDDLIDNNQFLILNFFNHVIKDL